MQGAARKPDPARLDKSTLKEEGSKHVVTASFVDLQKSTSEPKPPARMCNTLRIFSTA
jgi:hypothetical protein